MALHQEQKFFGSFFQKRIFVSFLLCSLAPAHAQKPPLRHTQVGAGDIFAALTQPDHPTEIEALHALQEALSGSPDPQKLDAARAKLAEVLRAEERHQGDMPPALVMSGIASRIEAAMAGLEEARHAPTPPPDRLQALVMPGLAAASAALGVALIACLAGLAARGRQAEEREELQDTLKKIKRRLEGGAPAAAAAGLTQDLAEQASGEASEAVHQATVAVDRLGSAARDAEGRLQTSVGEAEARLHAAAAMAGQLEQWMESLPERLSASVQAVETQGLPVIEAAAARIEESAAGLAGLQDLLADYGGAISGLTAQAERSAENLQRQLVAMHDRFDTLAGLLPERVASALPAAMEELNSAADLIAELSSLALGQGIRLEDIVTRTDKVACDLPAAVHLLETASAHLMAQINQDAKSSATSERVAEDLVEMSRLSKAAAESLAERLAASAEALEAQIKANAGIVAESLAGRLAAAADAMEARLADGADRVQARLEAGAEAVGEALAGQVTIAAEAAGARVGGRAELVQAGLESAAQAVADAAATLPAISDGLREAAAMLTGEAGGQVAALQQAAADLAAENATLLRATQARGAPDPASGAQPSPSHGVPEGLAQNLVVLTTRLETVLNAAEAIRMEAAEQAEAARARETDQVTTLFEVLAGRAEACLSALPSEAAALAATAAQLRGDAAELAASAMRADGGAGDADLIPSQASASLGTLQSVCQRLEQALAELGQTGIVLHEGIARIGHEAQRMQDGSASTQSVLASSAAALQDAGAILGQVLAGLRATEATLAGHPVIQEVQAQLAVLTGRLGTVLENLADTAGPPPQLAARVDELAAFLGYSNTLQAQAERLAAVLDRNEQLAERLAEAAVAVADAAGAAVERPVLAPDSLADAQPALAGLQAATETVQRAAARLLESAQAQDAALARAGQAAAAVAQLVASAPKADAAEGHALAGLNGLANLAETLQGEAETLAACVLRGDTVHVPPELISQTPVMLAAIETSIHRLRGTATALALASDGRLKAA